MKEGEEEERESEDGSILSEDTETREANKPPPTPEPEEEVIPNKYSEDDEYEAIVSEIESLDEIPNPPDKAKNAFAITLFCVEAAFDSRS